MNDSYHEGIANVPCVDNSLSDSLKIRLGEAKIVGDSLFIDLVINNKSKSSITLFGLDCPSMPIRSLCLMLSDLRGSGGIYVNFIDRNGQEIVPSFKFETKHDNEVQLSDLIRMRDAAVLQIMLSIEQIETGTNRFDTSIQLTQEHKDILHLVGGVFVSYHRGIDFEIIRDMYGKHIDEPASIILLSDTVPLVNN